MLKMIVKMFMPKPATLANMASKRIQAAINGCQKAEMISKCANIASSVTDIQKFISDTLLDGKVSDEETKQVEEKLVRLFEKVIEIACK